MPIFEYDCVKCGVSFEKLVRTTEKVSVTCPRCSSRRVRRRMSTFAHAVAGGSSTPKSSGASCSGTCSPNCKGCGHQH